MKAYRTEIEAQFIFTIYAENDEEHERKLAAVVQWLDARGSIAEVSLPVGEADSPDQSFDDGHFYVGPHETAVKEASTWIEDESPLFDTYRDFIDAPQRVAT